MEFDWFWTIDQMDVKLSDCVPNRLRRKAASGAIAFEPRLERNHPFANVRRSLRRNHGWIDIQNLYLIITCIYNFKIKYVSYNKI